MSFIGRNQKKMPRHREDPKKVPYTLHHVLFTKKATRMVKNWSKISNSSYVVTQMNIICLPVSKTQLKKSTLYKQAICLQSVKYMEFQQ